MNRTALNKTFLLDRVLRADPPPFALVHRPGLGVQVLVGEVERVARLDEVPLPEHAHAHGPQVMVLVPFRQVAERGFAAAEDGAPLLALRVRAHGDLPLAEVLARLPGDRVDVRGGRFDLDDEQYAAKVRTVIDEEIGRGEGANFVIRRTWSGQIAGYRPPAALALFRRLCERESGAYWTFVVHTGDRTFVGASPERHVSLAAGTAVMNPISGTYRYPPGGPTLDGLLEFLADGKEHDELYMVVDEELKMMARVCDGGGRLRGPWLRPMSRLAHTEYIIDGPSGLDARDVLRLTMPAPTVTGSPLAAACRTIAAHERTGRGYYGGVLALIQHGTLDSALLIRTADIDAAGRVEIGVGATLVRHSDPAVEAAETKAKAAALLAALQGAERATPDVVPPNVTRGTLRALRRRNEGLSGFWRGTRHTAAMPLAGWRIRIVDAEDDFTAMLAQLTRALGPQVRVLPHDAPWSDDHDLVIVGPGPGDPRDLTDARIARLHDITRHLLAAGTPFLSVCLGHQVLADELGLRIERLAEPAQGLQRSIPLYGRAERVGFYNTFVAVSDPASVPEVPLPDTGEPVHLLRDPRTGAVHAMRTLRSRSIQFHVESVLTEHGSAILQRMLTEILSEVPAEAATVAAGPPIRAHAWPTRGHRRVPDGGGEVGRMDVDVDLRGRKECR